ncbi:MAG TPA: crotonase/enoyl-CoA hydratase family protein [Solirubrobacteraceae bacterium]|jgi:enoyl-CoA hydratase|nr:crotonase/enoyl-CoA hydratase family protein [Solirubrobacteraceae bacterium]
MGKLATYERNGRIATIRMDDGKVNAFSIPMLRAIHEAFDQAERDRAVVVLSGREGIFSAGFDLNVFARGQDEILEMMLLGATLAERILSFPTPVVGACTGHALPAGAFLLLSADCRLGVDGPFRLGMNEVRIGMTVPWFAIEIARQRLHPAHFDRAVVTSTMYSPREAIAAGFLDRVVAESELEAASLEAAEALVEVDPAAHTATKLRARAGALKAVRSAIEAELRPEGFAEHARA